MSSVPIPGSGAAFSGSACPHHVGRPLMSQVWRDAVFAHWPVPETAVRALLPPGLEPDTFGGTAWVSLVGFEMEGLRIRGLPAVPGASRFPEFNVRTYVRGPEGPGVWFCSLDVPGRLPTLVARLGFALPYCRARVDVRRGTGWERWSVSRTWPGRATGSLATADSPDGGADPVAAELVDFLTARWRLYAATGSGRIVTAPVEHEPWTLRAVRTVSVDPGLAAAAGLAISGLPTVAHRAAPVGVRVGRPRLLRRPRLADEPLTVWFDDDCGVCTLAVNRLRRRADAAVVFRPNRELIDPVLRGAAEDAIVVTGPGTVATAVPAVRSVLRHCGSGGRIASVVLGLPIVRSVAGLVYRWVAANRAALSTRFGLAACPVPDPAPQAVRAERNGR
ncbi:MAG: DUF2071 domain-containing protein [Actinomycetota bacterium]